MPPDSKLDIKLVTVSLDDEHGLEVEFDGVSPYEAWAMVYWACEVMEHQLSDEDS